MEDITWVLGNIIWGPRGRNQRRSFPPLEYRPKIDLVAQISLLLVYNYTGSENVPVPGFKQVWRRFLTHLYHLHTQYTI